MSTTIIDTLLERHSKIGKFLEDQGEISLKSDSDDEFRKVLVLCIASYFEHLVTDAIIVLARSTSSEPIASLIKVKAVSRQYHTYFNWDGNNVNQFLKLFGDNFQNTVSAEIKKNSKLEQGAKAFLAIGQQRNILVHENFASVSLTWTTEEITQNYQSASEFVTYLTNKVQNCK